MKRLIIFVIIILFCAFGITHWLINEQQSSLTQHITIDDLKRNNSTFSDSTICLKKVVVLDSQTLLNYTKATITDDSKERILLLTNKPFVKGQTIDVIGKLVVVYQSENKSLLVFIDNGLKPSNEIFQTIKKVLASNY